MKVCVDTCSVIYFALYAYMYACMYIYTVAIHVIELYGSHLLCVLPCPFSFQESPTGTRVCCLYTHICSAHAVPHAVSGPDCAGLLPAVVALAVALLTVLLLLVAAVFTAILFYTSESLLIIVLTVSV